MEQYRNASSGLFGDSTRAKAFKTCSTNDPDCSINMLNIALIIGSARSGTSILGELIAAHPKVKYLHERHSVWQKAGLGDNGSHRLTEQHATPKIKQRLRKRFEREQSEPTLLVEKCPRNVLRVPFLRMVLPEAKIVHLMRDDHRVRVGRWRENLTLAEAQALEELLRPLLARLGYE